MASASNLLFLERKEHVRWAAIHLPLVDCIPVAVTAEALDAMEEQGIKGHPLCSFVDTTRLTGQADGVCRKVFDLGVEIESYIGKRLPTVAFEGPGFISGNAYYTQYMAMALVGRAYYLSEAVSHFKPGLVTVFEQDVAPALRVSIPQVPFLKFAERFSHEQGIGFSKVPLEECFPGGESPESAYGSPFAALRNISGCEASLPEPVREKLASESGLRLLMAAPYAYDWEPVLDRVRGMKGSLIARVSHIPETAAHYSYAYGAGFVVECDGERFEGKVVSSGYKNSEERELIGELFDRWAASHGSERSFNFLGNDVLSELLLEFRLLTLDGPALLRHCDEIVEAQLDTVMPHAVCFFSMPWLAAKRLAYHAAKRTIPTVCYQHGGAFGTRDIAQHELMELGYADYFLTYGSGVKKRESWTFSNASEFIPVGSSRCEQFSASVKDGISRNNGNLNVLWVGETSTQNGTGCALQVEDTRRYLMQVECLSLLGNAKDLSVIFRPYPGQTDFEGTAKWIERAGFQSVATNVEDTLEALVLSADLVIVTASSDTTWYEIQMMGKPLIVFAEETQTAMRPHYAQDLEAACLWCRTPDELIEVVRRVCLEREALLAEIPSMQLEFFEKYIVHKADGKVVDRVQFFLEGLSFPGQISPLLKVEAEGARGEERCIS